MIAFAKSNTRTAALFLGGLAALLGASGQAPAGERAHAIYLRVVMYDYLFTPSRIELRRGVAYRLHFVNAGKEWHDVTAPRFLKTVTLGNPQVLNETHDQLAMRPGSERDLYLVPQAAGHYRFYCADHDWAGMVGRITVSGATGDHAGDKNGRGN